MKCFVIAAVAAFASLTLAQDCYPHPPCPAPECEADQLTCWSENPWGATTGMGQCPTCPGECPPPPVCETFTCMEATTTSNYNGVECPNYCPTTCGPDQFMCEPDYDSNGCPMKPVCVPMDPCGDSSSQCPKTNDYQGCPVQPECGQDEILCGNDVSHMSMRQGQECAPVGWCMPAKMPSYKPGVECSTSCPVTCPADQVPCPTDYSQDGCPVAQTCAESMEQCPPRTRSWKGCPLIPPPMCNAEPAMRDAAPMVECPLGVDQDGCHMGFTCAAAGECPTPQMPEFEFADMPTTYA